MLILCGILTSVATVVGEMAGARGIAGAGDVAMVTGVGAAVVDGVAAGILTLGPGRAADGMMVPAPMLLWTAHFQMKRRLRKVTRPVGNIRILY